MSYPNIIDNADCCGGGTVNGHAPWCKGPPLRSPVRHSLCEHYGTLHEDMLPPCTWCTVVSIILVTAAGWAFGALCVLMGWVSL